MSDADSFDEFYSSTRQRVLACLYAATGDLAEAQDFAQEAYARAWQRWATISAYDDPEAWVRRVGWRLAMNRWRKARNWLTAQRRMPSPTPAPAPSEDTVAVTAALRQLPAEQRIAIVLHHLMDLPVDAVARETNAPVGTVKARLSRGRVALSALLSVPVEEGHRA